MALAPLMTWTPSQKRWIKKYRSVMYAVSCKQLGCDATKEASCQAANNWWRMKQAELEDSSDEVKTERMMARIGEVATSYQNGSVERMAGYDATDGHLEGQQAEIQADMALVDTDPGGVLERLVVRSVATPKRQATPDKTVAGQVAAFVARKRMQANSKEKTGKGISIGRYDAYRRQVESFRDWLGSDSPVSVITAAKLEDWQAHLQGLVNEDKLSASGGKNTLDTAKQFIRWLWMRELIELPRNIDSYELNISLTTKKVKTIPLAELNRMLADGESERMPLYLLLMMNCGMQQTDIANLRNSEVDWKAGRIKRKRSKTAKHEDVPEVDYKLWPKTFDLLKQHRSASKGPEDRVLLNEDGKPLVATCINSNGKESKTNNINTAYNNRLKKKLGIKSPMKLIRKTSASLLEDHKDYKYFKGYFLGHSPQSVADKHYVVPSTKEFDEALDWLRTEYAKTVKLLA